jgi:hypothetical protein
MTLPLRAAVAFMFLALALPSPAAGQATASLQLVSEAGATTELSLDSLRRMPQVELRGQIHDGPELVFRGPALDAVLALAGAPEGRDLRGPALRLVVLAEAMASRSASRTGRSGSCWREKSDRRAGSASSSGSASCGSASRPSKVYRDEWSRR